MNEGGEQLGLSLGPSSDRRLFSQHFLDEVLPTFPEYQALELGDLPVALQELWNGERQSLAGANEAQTEERFIKPVLEALGFEWTVQAGVPFASGRRQPDYALFANAEARIAGDTVEGQARYEHAVAVADAKRFDRPLDGRTREGGSSEDPVAQIIHYLQITRRAWAILTNGRIWRLYAAEGDLIEGACLEIDLIDVVQTGDPERLRPFLAFFGRQAFVPGPDGVSFLDRALTESKTRAVAVGDNLERQVFQALPLIAQGLLGEDDRSSEALAEAFDHALVLLYRLLFCLHAEARQLLPLGNVHYDSYSLRQNAVAVARDRDRGRVFSAQSDDLYNDLRGLFRIVDRGDNALGVNEYNGGLFAARAHPWLEGRFVPDSLLAPALDKLYRVGGEMVDYRDLSIRHLGTIYEKLLAYRLEPAAEMLTLVEDPARRRLTGSYFTPEEVVDAIVQRALDPLLAQRSGAVVAAGLTGDQALDALLDIRIVDPAMGSAHFLVSVVAYVALAIATDPSYDGDLGLDEIQRLVAERCVYGVDLNPMAVELARLALWLTTVKGDEPLTFLRNLRVGNSLVGADIRQLIEGGEDVFSQAIGTVAEQMLAAAAELEQLGSATADNVREKERLEGALALTRDSLVALANEAIDGGPEGAGGTFHWDLEFPEVFLGTDGASDPAGGFDAVLGNPPYVRIQDLGRGLAAWCRERYETASGSFDVYLPFIERGVKLLAPEGRLGYIVPSKWQKLEFGSRLRQWFADEQLVDELIDFGDAQIFGGATNYTCILIVDRVGGNELQFRQVIPEGRTVGEALAATEDQPAASFQIAGFGSDPWVLATGEVADVLRTAAAGTERLGDVAEKIFTGLQTSADPVYIVADRGRRGDRRVVYSKASQREVELEDRWLKPLASGADVRRYAFRPLTDWLLFPYLRDGGEMRLANGAELADTPATAEYLREHEDRLRGRESGKMDHDEWWAYVYPKSLGAHDSPKLGVPRLCERLRVAVDPAGGTYLDNVDVNGVLVGERSPSLWTLVALLNSRLLDFYFQRLSVPFRGAFMSANKQFIAPLPIKLPSLEQATALDAIGQELHTVQREHSSEHRGFLSWLEGEIGVDPATLPGSTILTTYDQHTLNELLATLSTVASRLSVDPASRTFRESLGRELDASLDRLAPLTEALSVNALRADALVYDVYEMPAPLRGVVDAEYDQP